MRSTLVSSELKIWICRRLWGRHALPGVELALLLRNDGGQHSSILSSLVLSELRELSDWRVRLRLDLGLQQLVLRQVVGAHRVHRVHHSRQLLDGLILVRLLARVCVL